MVLHLGHCPSLLSLWSLCLPLASLPFPSLRPTWVLIEFSRELTQGSFWRLEQPTFLVGGVLLCRNLKHAVESSLGLHLIWIREGIPFVGIFPRICLLPFG